MKKLLDGPKTPRLLQRIHWVADPISYMEQAAARGYSDIFQMNNENFPVFVSHPQALQQIFTLDTKQLAAPGNLDQVVFQPLLGDSSVVLLSDSSHRRQRQLLMPPFHGERILSYGQLICDITEKVMSLLPLDKPFRASTVTQDISLQVILQAVFGVYASERYQLLKRLLSAMLDVFRSPLTSGMLFFPWLQKDLGSWSPWGYFCRQRQLVNEILYAEIRERRQQQQDPNRTDILSLLIAVRDEAGQPMTDVELRDELITLLFVGHETTSAAMAWALYWVHHYREVGKKLLAELDRQGSANIGKNPDPTSIAKLPYLTATCNETLRIYPVSMLTLPRIVKEPIELLSYQLSPDTVIYGCIYLLHHRQNIYPEPKHFKPERFLERKFSPYEFMPFGAGARRCIGGALAMYEMKLVLATMLSNYQLELVEYLPVKPQRRGVIIEPAGGVKMVIKSRR